MTRPERRVLMGEIGAAHGIRGEVSIRSFTADPASLAGYGPLSDEAGKRTFVITALRVTGKGMVARLEGVNDRTAAERLRNVKLYVPRSRLPEPEAGAYYHEDLVGLRAEAPDGTALGTVVAVLNYGAGDLLELKREGEKETVLVPFTNACVPEVDLKAGTATVILPAMTGDDSDNRGEEEPEPDATGPA